MTMKNDVYSLPAKHSCANDIIEVSNVENWKAWPGSTMLPVRAFPLLPDNHKFNFRYTSCSVERSGSMPSSASSSTWGRASVGPEDGEVMSNKQFQVLLADTYESLRLHYMIRYRVFCVETQYEDAAAFPDKLERDQHDTHSVHFLLRVEDTGQWVGAMRLVIGSVDSLPLNVRCQFDTQVGARPDEITAEVSRLCVVGAFRRRKQEHAAPHVIPWDRGGLLPVQEKGLYRLERRREPEILLRLIQAAIQYGEHHKIRYSYALMAEPLLRILRRMGLRITPIGPACEHRGRRLPCLIDLEGLFFDIPGQPNRIHDFFQKSPAYMRYSEWQKSLATPIQKEREVTYKRG